MSIYRDRPTGVLIPLLLAAGLLATACTSTPAKSTSHVIRISCGTPTACLAAARTEGFHGTVLVPANAPVTNSGGHYDENRLLAIRPEGFLMLFTERDSGVVQTNAVLFRYGESTETNTLGWRIIGRFK